MFSPGETVVHKFVIPFDVIDINYVVVSYKKNGEIVLEKKVAEGFETEDENLTSFNIDLSQEESLLFEDKGSYTLQLNVLTKNFSRHTSLEIKGENGVQYLKGVMDGG